MSNDLKNSLKEALKATRARKPAKPKQPKRTKTDKAVFDKATAKAIARGISSADQRTVNLVVNPAMQQHGDYRLVDHSIVEVVEGGKVKSKTERKIRNLARTTIERWHTRGAFDDRQYAAILFYIAKHENVFGTGPRLSSRYAASVSRFLDSSFERFTAARIDDKLILRLLDQEVFLREPVGRFWVWQNVVIFDEPAGVAGSRLNYKGKQAEAVAREIVCNIAWKVAEVVIDQPVPRDLHELCLDIDRPRAPRGITTGLPRARARPHPRSTDTQEGEGGI